MSRTQHGHESSRALRRVALLLVLVLGAAACSGTPVEGGGDGVGFDDPAGGQSQDGGFASDPSTAGTQEPGAVAGAGTADPATPGDGIDSGATAGGVGGGSVGTSAPGGGSGGSGGSGAGGSGAGGRGGAGGSGGGGTAASGGGGPAIRDANLYSGDANTQGIADDELVLCGHAALVFAEAFDVHPEDLNLYWDVVNEAGGVHGRRVRMSWQDDAYSPDRAVQAAEACKSQNPFALIGGIGFDQIPSVRVWAEANKMLYFHHTAIEPQKTFQFSFSALPTVQKSGRAFGDYIAGRYGDRKVGIVWRQSENWAPGREAGQAVMEQRGVEIVADLPVTQNQGVYSQQILELQRSGAEVVWLWENALAAAQFIQQAAGQGYRPKYVVFPFQTTLDVLGSNGLDPSIDGVLMAPAYARGGYGNAFAEHGYPQEIARFEQAYAKHRPNTTTNDILFQTWLGMKGMHELLLRCGRDCTRNRFAGMFTSGLKLLVQPGCPLDFTRPDSFGGHIGGHGFFVLESHQHPSGVAFKTNTWCAERLG